MILTKAIMVRTVAAHIKAATMTYSGGLEDRSSFSMYTVYHMVRCVPSYFI